MKNYWFLSRPKRSLITILPILVAFSDFCVGKVWKGNKELQLKFEDLLSQRSIVHAGNRRSRKVGNGGGAARTYYKQLEDLGLIFVDDYQRVQLTCISEDILSGKITFVEAMILQLQRYQYPSSSRFLGSGGVEHRFKIHPFQFLFRLLLDERLNGYLEEKEIAEIVIHLADSESKFVFEKVVKSILEYRSNNLSNAFKDNSNKTYQNVANTFLNYLSLTQMIDRGNGKIYVREGKKKQIETFIEKQSFIPNPEIGESYQRAYGKGMRSRDIRNFKDSIKLSDKERINNRIQQEFLQLTIQSPIVEITPDIILTITQKTAIDEKEVERFLIRNYSKKHIDSFFIAYRELAYMGKAGAKDFELATCAIFKNIFKMEVQHIGALGNTPDVYIECDNWCGIIDNKAYKNGYSISGNHKRVMEDVYIPNYQIYGKTNKPLAFFSYLAGSFGKNINSQIQQIVQDTGIKGSACPIDIFINLAQDYIHNDWNHEFLKRVFSVNREVKTSDIF